MQKILTAIGLGVLLASISACKEEAQVETEERIRAIKAYYVSEPANADTRRYSGVIKAANTASLSFSANGTVKSVTVNQGDRVQVGDLLATLETEPFELDLKSAKAELDAKQSEYNQMRAELERQRELFKKGWIAKAAYEKSVAEAQTAEENVNLALAKHGLAQRDLSKAEIRSPFDGVISLRDIEPFTEVSAGATVFQLDSEGVMDVELAVSDTVIGRVNSGAPVYINAPSIGECGCEARVTEIGSQSDAANSVQVKATITKGHPNLIPGMSVDASVTLSGSDDLGAYLIPITSIAPGSGEHKGYIFKYDPDKGVVRKVAIKGAGGLDGNYVSVSEGVKAGDIIASAGVSFLRDNQSVKLMNQN